MNIVLVEDNPILNASITLFLKKKFYYLYSYQKADDLIEALPDDHIDLFILDIDLPDMDGFELMRVLKPHYKKSEFIFISFYTDIEHIGKAFNLGCADYLKKPFEVAELLLRVEKVMNRCSPAGTVVIDGSIRLHTEKRMLELEGVLVDLTEKENKLLKLLLQNRGNVVTYNTLSECVWGKEISQNTMAAVIRRLRKKLGTLEIKSVRDLGYRLL